MVAIISIVGVLATAAVSLMVLVMLSFVRTAMGEEVHQPGDGDAA